VEEPTDSTVVVGHSPTKDTMTQHPKVKATPEQVQAEIEANEKLNLVTPNYRKNRNKGVNREITNTTPPPTLEEVWARE